MAATKKMDTFANIAAVHPTEASAGTANYAKFAFPFSIMDKMALVLSRIEYWPGSLGGLNTSLDYLLCGVSIASTVADLTNQADPAIVDSLRVMRVDLGTAAAGFFLDEPFIKDFSSLAGGGLLVAPAPLYGFVISAGASGVMDAWVKLFYTYMELGADEYWQLVESRRIIST